MKRAIGITLLVVMLFALVAEASGEAITPLFVSIKQATAYLSISGSTATCEGTGAAENKSDSVSITVTLQKQSGSSWSDVASWSGSGTGSTSVSKTYSVSTGTYRVKTYCTVSGEATTVYSSTKTK